MKFEKGSIVKDVKVNVYEVKIEVMHGDADYFDTITVGDFDMSEEHLLEDLVNTMELMIKEYPYGRGGGEDYNDVVGFNKWFDLENMDDEEYDNLSIRQESLNTEWSYSDYGGQASIKSYKIYFYDENSVKYNVIIKY